MDMIWDSSSYHCIKIGSEAQPASCLEHEVLYYFVCSTEINSASSLLYSFILRLRDIFTFSYWLCNGNIKIVISEITHLERIFFGVVWSPVR